MAANTIPAWLTQNAPKQLVVPATPAASSNTGTVVAVTIGVLLLGLGGLYLYERRPSRAEAVQVAQSQLGIWVPKVQYSDIPPDR